MTPRIIALTLTLLLASVVFIGLAPTASALDDDCGHACVENCEAGIGTRVTVTCEVGHMPRTVDTCSFLQGCGDWYVTCTAFSGPESPRCGMVPANCTGSPWGELCYDWSRKYCSVWYDNGHWTVCLADRVDLQL